MKRQLFAPVDTMTPEEQEKLQLEIDNCKTASNTRCSEKDPPPVERDSVRKCPPVEGEGVRC